MQYIERYEELNNNIDLNKLLDKPTRTHLISICQSADNGLRTYIAQADIALDLLESVYRSIHAAAEPDQERKVPGGPDTGRALLKGGLWELPPSKRPEKTTDTGSGYPVSDNGTSVPWDRVEDATLVTSVVEDTCGNGASERKHCPVIDLDYEADLIPSTTPGHYHLYLHKQVGEYQYFAWLQAMADAGLVESGYVEASMANGYSGVRTPWTKKPIDRNEST